MNTESRRGPDWRQVWGSLSFVCSIAVLIALWFVLYATELLFTESHLVGYYCCVSTNDLPATGTLARSVSDFFRTTTGAHLPGWILVTSNVGLLFSHLRRTQTLNWRLPVGFFFINLLYLLLAFFLVSASWSFSDWLFGLRTSAYAGFERTGYGIVSHLLLWGGLLWTLQTLPKHLRSQPLFASTH